MEVVHFNNQNSAGMRQESRLQIAAADAGAGISQASISTIRLR